MRKTVFVIRTTGAALHAAWLQLAKAAA